MIQDALPSMMHSLIIINNQSYPIHNNNNNNNDNDDNNNNNNKWDGSTYTNKQYCKIDYKNVESNMVFSPTCM